ncbi:MAG: ATP-binding protein [Desulfovibrio sp.]|jgi:predicted AAA+ superfamily ATPase|nr:ATP-binding protein [Desulfovibrio sp.]
MYIKRHLEKTLTRIETMFGAILVAGSRQVGKTTLLRNAKPGLSYLTLDDPIMLASAASEPGTFFKAAPPPLVVDEIQHAPQLFPHIKMILDAQGRKGQFFLSGSQQYQMMRNVGESLAGRIGVLNLYGFSLRELCGIDCDLPFRTDRGYLEARKGSPAPVDYNTLWALIHRGAMPAMAAEGMDWQLFYAAYVRTYLERDVRDLAQVGDEVKFLKFMTAAAAMTGQLLNHASLARDAGVSQPTAERWLSVLHASNLVYFLQPYHNNIIKRAVKTSKIYFLDTGLAAYLTRWTTPEALRHGAMAGAFFESFVLAEILKSYANAGILDPSLYFYRDKEQTEIDLLLFRDQTLYPIEIKKYADPKVEDVKAFAVLDKIPGVTRGPGGLICLYDRPAPLTGEDMVIPLTYV